MVKRTDAKEIFHELSKICAEKADGDKMEGLLRKLKEKVGNDRCIFLELKALARAAKEHNSVNALMAISALLSGIVCVWISAFSSMSDKCEAVVYISLLFAIIITFCAVRIVYTCIKVMNEKKYSYIEIALEEYESEVDKEGGFDLK